MSDLLAFIIGYVLLIFERKSEQGELGASLGELPKSYLETERSNHVTLKASFPLRSEHALS